MRRLSGLAFLVVLTALGAVVGFRTAAPDRGTAAAPSPSADPVRGARSSALAREARSTGLRLEVEGRDGRPILSTAVGALTPTRVAGGFAPVDPPYWNEAVWVRYRPLIAPTNPHLGTSYIYGHACHHHVCAFTDLVRAVRGGSILVIAGGRTVTYRITSTSSDYPKSGPGSLAERTTGVADRSVPNRIVLITCAYEQGDVSLNNFVVIGQRV